MLRMGTLGTAARRRTRRAFSLVELLVVILIIGLLMTLLMPAIRSGWDVAMMTKCRANLNAIYSAQGVWRNDKQSSLLVSGESWMGRLYPYVDGAVSTFACPSAPERGQVVTSTGDSKAVFRNEWPGGGAGMEGGNERTEVSMEFDIYFQQGTSGNTMGNTGIRGALAWTVPVSTHPWVRRTDKGAYVQYEIDDEGSTGGAGNPPTYDDIFMNVYYDKEGQPTKIEVLKPRCTASPYQKFIYDFRINGEVVVTEWIKYHGQTLDVKDLAAKAGMVVVMGDYGLSRGTYETPEGLVEQVDPRLFFVLDYPKALANYADVDQDIWQKYFITQSPEDWEKAFAGKNTGAWRDYQALRHFGMANVLFCDGHIETLSADELQERDARWKYAGR